MQTTNDFFSSLALYCGGLTFECLQSNPEIDGDDEMSDNEAEEDAEEQYSLSEDEDGDYDDGSSPEIAVAYQGLL